MISDGYDDLHYGILIKNISEICDRLSVQLFDVGGNVNVSSIAISQPSSFKQLLDFEDGLMPPMGWRVVRKRMAVNNNNEVSTRPQVSNDYISAYSGKRGMLCRVSKFSKSGSYAGIEYKFPKDEYFELLVEAMINPFELELNQGNSIYPLYFLNSKNYLSVAAGIYRNRKNIIQVILVAKDQNGTIKHSNNNDDNSEIKIQKWQKWRLVLKRIDTRKTIIILYFGRKNNFTYYEIARMNYDSRFFKPDKVRIGIGDSSSKASGTLYCDNIRLTGNL